MRTILSAVAAMTALCIAPAAQAQRTEDEQVWINLTAMGSVSGPLVYFLEWQPRFGDGASRMEQGLARGAIGWKLSPKVTIYQGYAHVFLPIEGGPDRNEERSFQQISWNIGKPLGGELSSRTRLEQRWRSDGDDMGWRVREMLRFERAFNDRGKGSRALVYSELFVALNDTDWGARSGFDQIRNFVGLEIPVGGPSTIEAGYLNQYIDQTGGRSRMNHAASITLFFRH